MLIISRKNVSRTEITEFDTNKRYIKLPIDTYLKLLPGSKKGSTVFDELNDPQIALINAINDPRFRFISAALARRLGKTYISNIIGQLVLLIPNCNVLIMSPNYNLSTISFELQRKLIGTFDLEIIRDNLKDRILEISNGSTVRMGSVSQVDSCVGRSYDLIIFDEAALSSNGEAAFNVSLRPTLDKPNSKCIFISTPRGKKNWFSRFYARGFDEQYDEWCSLTADYSENKRMSDKDVAEAKRSMSAAEFDQEYMASFTSYQGQVYMLSEENIIDELPEGNYEYFGGLDPGYKDPTAFIVVAYNIETEIFYIVADYLEAEKVTAQHASAIQELINEYAVETIFIDSAAAQLASDLAYIYDIATTKAKKEILPGITFVQNLVQQDRIKILRRCTNTLDALDQYQWDPNDNLTKEKPVHNEASHMADALRYALYTFTT
jgi:PBSX family phage terminase large subunit